MEENSGASESDAVRSVPSFKTRQAPSARAGEAMGPFFACRRNIPFPRTCAAVSAIAVFFLVFTSCDAAQGDALDRIHSSGRLRYGSGSATVFFRSGEPLDRGPRYPSALLAYWCS